MICAAFTLCRFVLVDDLNKSDVRSSPSAALSTPFLCLTLEEQTTVTHTYFQLVDQADPPPTLPPLAWSWHFDSSAFAHLHCIASLASHSICKSRSALTCCRFGACAANFAIFPWTYIHNRGPRMAHAVTMSA
jgi:hypothetical protein